MKKNVQILKVILCCLLLMFAFTARAQQPVQIKGLVTNEKGEKIIGATITVAGGNEVKPSVTITNDQGSFAISGLKNGISYRLSASYIGYKTFEKTNILVNENEANSILITLEKEGSKLAEVVVVGYGSQRKTTVTGSISKLKGESFEGQQVTSMEQALAGQLAGVQVTQGSGAPGGANAIKIRGSASITPGTNPLIVIDGFPLSDANTSSVLNPADIESIEVLKDASSAAIYGSRGSNGVILINPSC